VTYSYNSSACFGTPFSLTHPYSMEMLDENEGLWVTVLARLDNTGCVVGPTYLYETQIY
jgi:hypothetical protein